MARDLRTELPPDSLKFKPLLAALWLAITTATAAEPALPDLGQGRTESVVVRPNPNGLTL